MQANYLAGTADDNYEQTRYWSMYEELEEAFAVGGFEDELGLAFDEWAMIESERGWTEGCLDRSEIDAFFANAPDYNDYWYDPETDEENQCHGDGSEFVETYAAWIEHQGSAHFYRAKNYMLEQVLDENVSIYWCGTPPSYDQWDA